MTWDALKALRANRRLIDKMQYDGLGLSYGSQEAN